MFVFETGALRERPCAQDNASLRPTRKGAIQMKRMRMFLMSSAVVLACCLFAAAQGNMSDDAMKNDKSMKHDSDKMMSMTGCIAEKDGKYMMMDKSHPDGVQLVSSEDLKPHVGHKVKVSGIMGKMDNMGGDSMKSDDKMAKDDKMMKHDSMMSMKVSSMKMVSDKCEMSMMH
jgi:hypothetical protein